MIIFNENSSVYVAFEFLHSVGPINNNYTEILVVQMICSNVYNFEKDIANDKYCN